MAPVWRFLWLDSVVSAFAPTEADNRFATGSLLEVITTIGFADSRQAHPVKALLGVANL
jgi:hypothetical protein